jgi:hypothetical protein
MPHLLLAFVSTIGDNNRGSVDSDMLKEGMKNYMNSMAWVYLYKFIARYVRKVHPDSIITQDLSKIVGVSFINMITPSDIAYVICLVKNGKDLWDQKI